ncbi:hypothetical protein RJT34_16032 [Clitoria ternatea]|uniref:Uncharacterized protein n=1 Tax=Clitoria ternatea TaxID=43366 RepID=A0AAN9J6G2_CLITE
MCMYFCGVSLATYISLYLQWFYSPSPFSLHHGGSPLGRAKGLLQELNKEANKALPCRLLVEGRKDILVQWASMNERCKPNGLIELFEKLGSSAHQGMEIDDDDDDEMEVEDREADEVESEFKDKVLGVLKERDFEEKRSSKLSL